MDINHHFLLHSYSTSYSTHQWFMFYPTRIILNWYQLLSLVGSAASTKGVWLPTWRDFGHNSCWCNVSQQLPVVSRMN